MLSLERKRNVLNYLKTHGTGQVLQMAEALGVSQSTIRRDLTELEDQGLLTRVHGGASLAGSAIDIDELEEAPTTRRSRMREEKRRIGEAAARLVGDRESVLITGGSTAEAMLPHLADRTGLTVITNGINVAMALVPYDEISVVVLGGVLRHSELSLLGSLAAKTLESFHVDRAFIGCYGIDPKIGLTGAYADEASTDTSLVSAVGEINVLADSTKFSSRGPARILPAGSIRRLITDGEAPEEGVEQMRALGVEVQVV